MKINEQHFNINGTAYTIRSAAPKDAQILSVLRLRIDGETENLDREPGEAFIDGSGFERLIREDTKKSNNLFLVAVVDDSIVGFSRCEGNPLKRLAHKVEFGVCVLQEFWGCGIGKNLLMASIAWADANGIKKMALAALETNKSAINLYKKLGFQTEGILQNDKLLSDGNYYNTVLMGRLNKQ
ncbi:GNAT family N-acetyltransferase [Planomicrobium sp. CPCC 101079]|uniref:GNAT family N-acetyltransferase n=1 Tax=Planomicrobium sp. CPCC 101079 TaxID=2599618 RepID=UPI0011B478E2|nr:GNAT family N-acetyltransferase [Planomicrobium sp. CPCC 101079]TWT02532.1 GNAT family N-acetyltransferase [Planomicrobium sp. CPCC 101079]